MGVEFSNVVYSKNDFYKIGIYAGQAKTWRRCKACGESIQAGTDLIGVHSFGEVPTMFHSWCAGDIADALNDSKIALAFDK